MVSLHGVYVQVPVHCVCTAVYCHTGRREGGRESQKYMYDVHTCTCTCSWVYMYMYVLVVCVGMSGMTGM